MADRWEGERPGARDAMARTANQWKKDGMDPALADKKAREIAIRFDQTQPKNPERKKRE